jgi:16S rRNA (guanine527-N7)-methyltransferase
LVEPRKLRADFLQRACCALRLNAAVATIKVERLTGTFDVITGRAVAPLGKFIAMAQHLSTGKSVWVLPKGRTAIKEVEHARGHWQGRFHVEPSATAIDSFVVIGTGIRGKP